MKRLKADFHTHTADDPRDAIDHSAEMLIDSVARLHYDVLAITCHERIAHTSYLAEYARRRGVLLMPGIELALDGKHVVLLNPDEEQAAARTFDELRALGRRDAVCIAVHPFYPTKTSLGPTLRQNIDLFDAIEHCSLYYAALNFNRRAAHIAQEFDLPMVGTSDCHSLPYSDDTFSWVDAEPTVEGVLDALRDGRVSVESQPRPAAHAASIAAFATRGTVRVFLGK